MMVLKLGMPVSINTLVKLSYRLAKKGLYTFIVAGMKSVHCAFLENFPQSNIIHIDTVRLKQNCLYTEWTLRKTISLRESRSHYKPHDVRTCYEAIFQLFSVLFRRRSSNTTTPADSRTQSNILGPVMYEPDEPAA